MVVCTIAPKSIDKVWCDELRNEQTGECRLGRVGKRGMKWVTGSGSMKYQAGSKLRHRVGIRPPDVAVISAVIEQAACLSQGGSSWNIKKKSVGEYIKRFYVLLVDNNNLLLHIYCN